MDQRAPNRGGGQRHNKNVPRNAQNRNSSGNNQNRNANNRKKLHSQHLWTSSTSSTTLTSHLSMIDRRSQNVTSKNASGKNGTGRLNEKPGGNLNRDQKGKNRNHSQEHPKRRYRGNQSNSNYKHRSHNEPRNVSTKPTQQNKPEYNKMLESKTNTFGIDPFELFCAYHLGISRNNQYRPSNINEVANRFKLDTGVTRQILKDYGMDSASLLDRDFDMAMAQLDIQVAPEGVNRTELARNIFEDFLEAPIKKRDWKKILEEDKKENAKTFSHR